MQKSKYVYRWFVFTGNIFPLKLYHKSFEGIRDEDSESSTQYMGYGI